MGVVLSSKSCWLWAASQDFNPSRSVPPSVLCLFLPIFASYFGACRPPTGKIKSCCCWSRRARRSCQSPDIRSNECRMLDDSLRLQGQRLPFPWCLVRGLASFCREATWEHILGTPSRSVSCYQDLSSANKKSLHKLFQTALKFLKRTDAISQIQAKSIKESATCVVESDQLQSPWCITSAILRSFQPGFAEILRGAEAPSDAAQWLAWAKMAHQAHSAAPGCPGDWRIGDPGLEVWLQDLGDFVTVLKKLHQATNGATMLAILPYCSSCSENSTMDLAGVSLSHQLGQKKSTRVEKIPFTLSWRERTAGAGGALSSGLGNRHLYIPKMVPSGGFLKWGYQIIHSRSF